METNEYLSYDEVAEAEDEENHDEKDADKKLPPGPAPDNPIDCLSPAINPSPCHSPMKKKPMVVPLTQQSTQRGWQQSKRNTQSMQSQQEKKMKKKKSAPSHQSPQQEDEQQSTHHHNKNAASPKKAASRKKKMSFGYLKDDINAMPDTITYILPIGPDEWNEVAKLHAGEFLDTNFSHYT